MAYALRLFIVSLFFFISFVPADAEDKAASYKYNGEIGFIFSGLPQFDQYPATEKPAKIAADIDWSSSQKAWQFRTRLREGLKKGANFAGKYAVITNGCGSSCQMNWIVDVETGRVMADVTTSFGAFYNKDSRLLVTDLPWTDLSKIKSNEFGIVGSISFYILDDDKLALKEKITFPWRKIMDSEENR